MCFHMRTMKCMNTDFIMASIIVDNTLGRIKKFADIQRAAVIFMSLFLMSFRNSLGERT